MLDIAVPTNETRGVAFGLDADGDFSMREVIDIVEWALHGTESTATRSDT